jgi:hypothetical protein
VVMIKSIDLSLAAFITALLLGYAHLSDWHIFKEKPNRPPWSYVAGVALMDTPLLALLAYWRDWWAFSAVIIVTIGAGLPVLFGYSIRGQTEKPSYEMLLSEHLADEREISLRLRHKLMEKERENAVLIAKLAALEAGNDE